MSDTPETDAFQSSGKAHYMAIDFARKLERERDEARVQTAMWKANHDNQVSLKAMLMDRPDLGDRASRIAELIRERDEARRELSLKCQSVTIANGTISDLLKKSERLEKQIEGLNNFANERFDEIQRVRRERDEAREAIKNFYKAKGRHNSQIAAARMFELVGLPAEYPQVKAPK
jgi:hypothetical protein